MIKWIRHRHGIPAPQLKGPDEFTVQQVCDRFGVSRYVVYYWIEREIVEARQLKQGSPYWIKLTPAKEQELADWVRESSRIKTPQKCESLL
jgi:transposase